MNPPWQQLYQAALLEIRPEQFGQRITAAEKAMELRLEALRQSEPGFGAEREAIVDALRRLRVLADSEDPLPTGDPNGYPNKVAS
jgi:hypothetical protein